VHLDSFLMILRKGDSSRAYQIGFQDPATTTMEGIYLFNLHLLALIIVRCRTVRCLSSVILICYSYLSYGLSKRRQKSQEMIAIRSYKFTWILKYAELIA
jgi:hypothetical protein